MNEEITIERLIEDLDNLYGNDCFNYNREQSDKLANDIRNLINQNKEKQDKLNKIKSYCEDDNEYMGNDSYINGLNEGNKEIKNGVLKIIKGEDK